MALSDTIHVLPFKLLFSVLSQVLPHQMHTKGFLADQQAIQCTTLDVLDLTKARIALAFDNQHQPVVLKGHAYIKLVRHN